MPTSIEINRMESNIGKLAGGGHVTALAGHRKGDPCDISLWFYYKRVTFMFSEPCVMELLRSICKSSVRRGGSHSSKGFQREGQSRRR
jgi:hypothetical protein